MDQPRVTMYAGNAAATLVGLYILLMGWSAYVTGDSVIFDNVELMSHGIKNIF